MKNSLQQHISDLEMLLRSESSQEAKQAITNCLISAKSYLEPEIDLDKLNELMFNAPVYFEPGYESKLRDTFAGQAMNGLLIHYGNEGNQSLCETSYSIADEMLKQRNNKNN